MTMQAIEKGNVFAAAAAGTATTSTSREADAARPIGVVPGEVVYYEDENVRISSENAVFGIKQHAYKTYPVREITAVQMRVQRAHVFPAYCVALIGLAIGVALLSTTLLLGLLIGAVGIIIGLSMRAGVSNNYMLHLTSRSGETDVLMSQQKAYIQQAIKAIDVALAGSRS